MATATATRLHRNNDFFAFDLVFFLRYIVFSIAMQFKWPLITVETIFPLVESCRHRHSYGIHIICTNEHPTMSMSNRIFCTDEIQHKNRTIAASAIRLEGIQRKLRNEK